MSYRDDLDAARRRIEQMRQETKRIYQELRKKDKRRKWGLIAPIIIAIITSCVASVTYL
jgi:hypothetical protein